MNPVRPVVQAFVAVREYVILFFDGEAEVEDYVLVILLILYAFILVFHAWRS